MFLSIMHITANFESATTVLALFAPVSLVHARERRPAPLHR
jgi:hypothetical protein